MNKDKDSHNDYDNFDYQSYYDSLLLWLWLSPLIFFYTEYWIIGGLIMNYKQKQLDLINYLSQQVYELKDMKNDKNNDDIDYLISTQNYHIRIYWSSLLHS